MLLILLILLLAPYNCSGYFKKPISLASKTFKALNLFARKESSIPTVVAGHDQRDILSFLLKERILVLGSEVNDEVANSLVAQILYLAADDAKSDITLYINSPGGSVQAGLAIFDTMQYVPCDISTVSIGMSASMGAFLLSAGTKGKRKSFPNSRIMIHQPLGGSQGEASDIEVTAKLLLHTKSILNLHLSQFCDQPIEKIQQDTDRDFYMTAEEARRYGVIDSVIPHKMMPLDIHMPMLDDYATESHFDMKGFYNR